MLTHQFETLLINKPPLHNWGGNLVTGGFEDDSLRLVFEIINKSRIDGVLRIIEIGAGLTTLAGLCASPEVHIAISPEIATEKAIRQYAINNDINLDPLNFINGFSQIELPRLIIDTEPRFTCALIDGGHNFTQCWVDYVYCAAGLIKGGIMMVDDIEIPSCRLLALFMRNNKNWIDIGGQVGKCKFFQKITDFRYDGDFVESPLIMNQLLF